MQTSQHTTGPTDPATLVRFTARVNLLTSAQEKGGIFGKATW